MGQSNGRPATWSSATTPAGRAFGCSCATGPVSPEVAGRTCAGSVHRETARTFTRSGLSDVLDVVPEVDDSVRVSIEASRVQQHFAAPMVVVCACGSVMQEEEVEGVWLIELGARTRPPGVPSSSKR